MFIVLDVITEAEASKGRVPGLERTVPKTKGVEFGSLLHQLAVDFNSSPYSPKIRSIILEIEPSAKDRLPKREAKKPTQKAAPKKTAKSKASSTKSTATKKSASGKTTKKSATKRLAKRKPR